MEIWCGNERAECKLWMEFLKKRSQIAVAEINFLWRLAGLSLRTRINSLVILEVHRVELLFLPIERNQFRWSGHLTVTWARRFGPTRRGRPRTGWQDHTSVSPLHEGREVWTFQFRLCPCNLKLNKLQKMNEKLDCILKLELQVQILNPKPRLKSLCPCNTLK